MHTVLVVDDKELLRDSVGATLQRAGFSVVTADSGPGALAAITRKRPDAVVSDLKMPGMTGIELLEQIKQVDDQLPVILMTAYGAVDTAVKAIKFGAFDYITKPFEGDELIIAVKRAIEHARIVRENAVLRTTIAPGGTPAGRVGLDRIVGDSPAMRRVKQQILAVADSQGTVLICGESGTGKEVVARSIHELSPRCQEPFLGVNCAALSESLLESELFGHERGAFTGAERLRKGRFELADKGTLLLDEISEISPAVQAKLLRVLQERAFERVGSSMAIGVDVRTIATSNRDLPASVARGEFRQDLFFRLNVLPIHLPSLRDRLEDVPALAVHFLAQIAAREGKPAKTFSNEAMTLLQSYRWPGNVRELSNICERAAVLCKSDTIDLAMIEPWLLIDESAHRAVRSFDLGTAAASPLASSLPSGVPGAVAGGLAGGLPVGGALSVHVNVPNVQRFAQESAMVVVEGRVLEDIEREAIVKTLNKYNGHRQRTAQALGIGVRTLGLKLKKWKELQLVEASL
ncbi:MAG TPA: sigma-54 dependent transcriptional regulator [Phycisphaerales bacterium]|nr:sigma-54 dependent transcriptional regulator [Phycisphaerales bacterium]